MEEAQRKRRVKRHTHTDARTKRERERDARTCTQTQRHTGTHRHTYTDTQTHAHAHTAALHTRTSGSTRSPDKMLRCMQSDLGMIACVHGFAHSARMQCIVHVSRDD